MTLLVSKTIMFVKICLLIQEKGQEEFCAEYSRPWAFSILLAAVKKFQICKTEDISLIYGNISKKVKEKVDFTCIFLPKNVL